MSDTSSRPAAAAPAWVLRADAPDPLTFRIMPGAIKTVGRAVRADFILEAPLVSRVHCRFTSDALGQLLLEDLGSTNGTYVNDRRVDRAAIVAGDRIRIGRVEFVIAQA
jgi:pSer/pThr/pTyr-binding forkhead associated (FHA) protein